MCLGLLFHCGLRSLVFGLHRKVTDAFFSVRTLVTLPCVDQEGAGEVPCGDSFRDGRGGTFRGMALGPWVRRNLFLCPGCTPSLEAR
jgi:hypothetical protein